MAIHFFSGPGMTLYLQIDPENPDLETIEKAAEILREGGLAAFPTETVYGLGAAASRPEAVERLRQVKARPDDKPFSFLLSTTADVFDLVAELPLLANDLVDRYWPGPLTLVLPQAPGSTDLVGVRLPGSALARMLVAHVGAPLAAPSANPSGKPPATTGDEVREYFDGKVDVVLDGGPVTIKQSSTVVKVDNDGYEVLRAGIITTEMVQQLVSGKVIVFVCTGNTCRSPMAAALFRKHLAAKLDRAEDDLEECGFRILSCGTFAMYGARASENAVTVMTERDCDVSRHISAPVTRELLARADRSYAMTASHHATLLEFGSDIAGMADRVCLLGDHDVSDPVGQSVERYRACADEIEAAVREIVAGF